MGSSNQCFEPNILLGNDDMAVYPRLNCCFSTLVMKVVGIRASAKNKRETADRLAVQVRELEQQIGRQKERASGMEEQLKVRGAQSQDISSALMQKTAERNDLAEQRKEKWRVLEELQVCRHVFDMYI